ncbi:AVAST type 1 anti-phage system protein Avs1c [Roseivirga seohaensis]|uniref:AVAST type 1 anti-phage system protein Avs1c n=1 Tax=Roseivirga seohaensis TaxID=1914963 RepID=UPI00069EFD66|nr:AVAST type 1 anti-phage system protein Avs1c [Roseivirga seohaensis]
MFEPKGYHIKSRKEFERNLNTTAELSRRGKVQIGIQAKKSVDSLVKVRSLPNKRIDLSTVNELVRAFTNLMVGMNNRANSEDDET